MADYYSPTVVHPDIPLSDMTPLERLLLAQIFESEPDGDALYFFEAQSINEMLWLDVGEVREALAQSEGITSEAATIVTEALAGLGEDAVDLELDLSMNSYPFLFQDIIRRSATLEHVTVTSAFTCSKMRPDGFGGMVTVIIADQVLSSSTSEMEYALLDRAEYGELACAPGPGSHVLLRLSEEEVRGTLGEIFETEAPEGLATDEVTDADIREACLVTVEHSDLSHEAGEIVFRSAIRALTLAAERKQAAA
jgi:hypothetical protein